MRLSSQGAAGAAQDARNCLGKDRRKCAARHALYDSRSRNSETMRFFCQCVADGDRPRDQRFPGVANAISSKIPGTLLSRIDDSSIEMRVLAQTLDRFDRLIERACAKIVATRTPDLLEG